MTNEIVTNELIDSLANGASHSKEALAYLGVPWPPERGWKHRILGRPRKPLAGTQELLVSESMDDLL
jgi:hypothetical protein